MITALMNLPISFEPGTKTKNNSETASRLELRFQEMYLTGQFETFLQNVQNVAKIQQPLF